MITDPQAVKWANERARPLADRIAQLQAQLAIALAEWQAKGLASLIPNDGTVIADGSATDGRTPITGADVNGLIALLQTLQGMATGQNSSMPTVLKIAVNPIS